MFKVVRCRAEKNGWVDLLRWEVLLRHFFQLRGVELLLVGEEELEDAQSQTDVKH